MTAIVPVPFTWDGDAMVPRPGFAKRCDEMYYVGEVYLLEPREDRSMRSHRQYFAALHEIWMNLPIEQAGLFPTVEHLRKWLLIKTGYRHERVIVAADAAEARKIQALVRSMDQFAVIQRKDNIVTVWTAESQSMRSQKKDRFQQSKTDVLDEGASMIGKTREAVEAHAKTADVP